MIRLIADIGSNHNGSLIRAKRMIDDLSHLNFWGVKFQMFKSYGIWENKLMPEETIFKKEWLPKLKEHCKKRNIKLGMSVFYEDAINECKKYVDFFKISSFDINRINLIVKCLETKKETIISTGLVDFNELMKIKRILTGEFLYLYNNVTWLHCISSYPTELKKACINRIIDLKTIFENNEVGYSDHTGRVSAIFAALIKGAEIIELHYDRDDKEGYETKHGHCWNTSQLSMLMQFIKDIQIASEGKFILTEKQLKQRAHKITGLRG